MARKKSSLDIEEPVLVQGEEIKEEPIVEATAPTVEKAEIPAVVEKKETKADTQDKTTEKKAKRGVKICVI